MLIVIYQRVNCTTIILAAVLKHRRIEIHWSLIEVRNLKQYLKCKKYIPTYVHSSGQTISFDYVVFHSTYALFNYLSYT